MWLESLALYLRDQNIAEIPSTSIFMHTIPPEFETAAMLVTGYQGMPVDNELPGFHKGQVQLIVRSKNSKLAEEIAQSISDSLTFEEQQVGDILVHYLRPRHLPVLFPRSNGDYYEASVNFDICFVR